MKRIKSIALDGLFKQNPLFKLVLGTCPALAVTKSISSGFGMGMAVIFVLICSNVTISLLRNIIPDKVRIPCFIMVIATFVTVVMMLTNKLLPELNESLGLFLPLIVVNCLILARAESFASSNTVGYSAVDGLFMGAGFTLGLVLMSFVRELLGSGTVYGVQVWNFKLSIFTQPAGAFLTYGFLIAAFVAISNGIERKLRQKQTDLALEAGQASTEVQ